jgi:mono/diheme cytochrome c family protein
MKLIQAVIIVLVVGVVGAVLLAYAGAFNVAADVPHGRLTYNFLEMLRDRSIAVRAGEIRVPQLDDPKMIAAGAAHYAEMCSGCHLAPGLSGSEIREGLYPQPPKLIESKSLLPAREFWVIKHGIWTTAMPAWGTTHSDTAIWNIVAFLRKLPDMQVDEYKKLTAGAEQEHEHEQEGQAH